MPVCACPLWCAAGNKHLRAAYNAHRILHYIGRNAMFARIQLPISSGHLVL